MPPAPPEAASGQHRRLQVPASGAQRLDRFLASALPDYSRSRLQALIKDGFVHVDGRQPKKTGFALEGGEVVDVHIPPPEPVDLIPEPIPLDIVYEDHNLIVVDKPAGMVVHPSAGHSRGTLIHAVLAHAPDIEGVGGELRPGLVHRLDKDTSGLILLAKDERTQRFLQRQFQDRKVEKTYLALVDGHPPTPTGRIEAPIGRDPHDRKKMAVVSPGKGRPAITEYRQLEAFPDHTLLEVDLHTGRTHQIRLHLAFLGCPVTGDTVYGRHKPSLPLKRFFLHAARLAIKLPGERVLHRFEAPLPEELRAQLDLLRRST